MSICSYMQYTRPSRSAEREDAEVEHSEQCFQNALIRHARNGLLKQDHSVSGVCVDAGILNVPGRREVPSSGEDSAQCFQP